MVKTVKIQNKAGTEWFRIVPNVKKALAEIGVWYRKIVSIRIQGDYVYVEISE